MEKQRIGFIVVLIGVLLFLVSLFIVLPSSEDNYLVSLLGMFAGIVLIAIGFAVAKRIYKSIEVNREDCYYCKGSGKIDHNACPRCGGTGIAPVDE